VKSYLRAVAVLLAIGALSACSMRGPQSALPQPPSDLTSHQQIGLGEHPATGPGPIKHACEEPRSGFMHCDALVRTDIVVPLAITPDVVGYGPKSLRTAYGLLTASSTGGVGQTVAIVDAFKDTHANGDLAVYRANWKEPACTTTTGCLTIKAFGTVGDGGWGEEESLDLDMVSAICPKCKILLVEAADNSTANLTTAELYAVAHANAVSNSWGGSESGPSSFDAAYKSSTVAITSSTGDSGFNLPAQWPAILPSVVGVGGTTLSSVSPRTESGWSGAGSGCSVFYAKPGFQTGVTTGCTMRAQGDVSAVADPGTCVAVYDTFMGDPGWECFGGTSVASPMIASVFALVGIPADNHSKFVYANKSHLNDVKTGPANGGCGAPLCVPGIGWDGPTGLGTPNGTGAF
jgi:subtilase family serine protease